MFEKGAVQLVYLGRGTLLGIAVRGDICHVSESINWPVQDWPTLEWVCGVEVKDNLGAFRERHKIYF